MKTKRLNFRVSETMDALIRMKADEAKLSLTDYIVLSAINKKIINYDGLKEVAKQIKKLGNNVNQLVILARQERIKVVNLIETQEELKRIHQLISSELKRK